MITYDIDLAAGLVVCRASGGVGVLDIANHLQALVRDSRFHPGLNTLIIANDIACIPPFSLLRYLDPLVAAWTVKRGAARWAFVLPNEAARSMAETELKHLTLNRVMARCFVDQTEAHAWAMQREDSALPPHRTAKSRG